MSRRYFSSRASAESGVEAVEVFAVQSFADLTECLAEALEMDYFALTEKLYGLSDIGIIHKTQNVIISGARLLLRRHILRKIGYKSDTAVLRCNRRKCACRRRGRKTIRHYRA